VRRRGEDMTAAGVKKGEENIEEERAAMGEEGEKMKSFSSGVLLA
jgi:hypothetical protein